MDRGAQGYITISSFLSDVFRHGEQLLSVRCFSPLVFFMQETITQITTARLGPRVQTVRSNADPKQVLPLAKVALEAHALGDLLHEQQRAAGSPLG